MSISKRHLRCWSVLVAVSVLAVTAACSDDSEPQAARTDSDVDSRVLTTEGASGDDTETTDAGSDVSTEEPGSDPPPDDPPGEALATVEGQTPFGQLEITDLRRVDDTVTLDFVVVATEDGGYGSFRDRFSAPEDQEEDARQYAASGVTLVDKTNQQRHLVLRDSQGTCLCTDFGDPNVGEGQRYPGSVQFPAPPEDVEEMTVEFPTFPAVDSVPLRRG